MLCSTVAATALPIHKENQLFGYSSQMLIKWKTKKNIRHRIWLCIFRFLHLSRYQIVVYKGRCIQQHRGNMFFFYVEFNINIKYNDTFYLVSYTLRDWYRLGSIRSVVAVACEFTKTETIHNISVSLLPSTLYNTHIGYWLHAVTSLQYHLPSMATMKITVLNQNQNHSLYTKESHRIHDIEYVILFIFTSWYHRYSLILVDCIPWYVYVCWSTTQKNHLSVYILGSVYSISLYYLKRCCVIYGDGASQYSIYWLHL